MPTPAVYEGQAVDPFAHIDTAHRNPSAPVYYLTNRAEEEGVDGAWYGNDIADALSFGQVKVQIGPKDIDWTALVLSSLDRNRADDALILTVGAVEPLGQIPLTDLSTPADPQLTPELQQFVDRINAELAKATDKEIMLYVHGTKVDFANAVSITAELDFFSGRDYVGVSYAWPSHQNILSYLIGVDVHRARASSDGLRHALTVLARHTNAEHINILCYSAGGRVTSKALYELREAHRELSTEQLRARYRIGALVFAAADVEVDTFLERLPDISELAKQVVITVSDHDNALIAGKRFMGGAARIGTTDAELREENFIVENHLANVEILDVSKGKEIRGFDIDGHHYWYRHPWTSSDMIFLMRTDLPPMKRGLTESEQAGVWFMAEDYPARVSEAAERALQGQW